MAQLGARTMEQIEYFVGLLIGVVAARSLLPLCLSILSSFTESVMNLKAAFPGSAFAGYLLVFVTVQAVPVFITAFCVIVQTVGDVLLISACVAMACYVSLPMLTGWRIVRVKQHESQVLYCYYWWEYGLRVFLICAIIGLLIAWAYESGHGLEAQEIIGNLLRPSSFLTILFGYIRGKALSTVAGTDLLIQLLGGSILWTAENDQEGHEHRLEILRNLRSLVEKSPPLTADGSLASSPFEPSAVTSESVVNIDDGTPESAPALHLNPLDVVLVQEICVPGQATAMTIVSV